MNRFSRVFLFAFLVLTAACDKGGLYPYGRLTDVIVPCGPDSSVYLRSTAAGTDILIIGRADPSANTVLEESRCLVSATVLRDSTTTVDYGVYSKSGSGAGKFEFRAIFQFLYQPHLTVSGRAGSSRDDFKPGTEFEDLSINPSGDTLEFDFYDRAGTYTRIGTVMSRIDLATPEGQVDLYQLYNLTLFLGQARIPAFGGLGMTRYISAAGVFQGITSGEYSISVNSLADPTATMRYTTLRDFPNIEIDGTQVTGVNISGDGPMRGALDFTMYDPANPTVVLFQGNVDYLGLQVKNGIADSGHYTLNVTSPVTSSTEIDFSYASNVDLRHVLPEDGP